MLSLRGGSFIRWAKSGTGFEGVGGACLFLNWKLNLELSLADEVADDACCEFGLLPSSSTRRAFEGRNGLSSSAVGGCFPAFAFGANDAFDCLALLAVH